MVPSFHTLINRGQGCPKCAYDSWDFRKTYYNKHTWDFTRFLYYVKFQHITSGRVFWKIGLNKSNDIEVRYHKGALSKDKLLILNSETIKLSNFNATLTEFYVLQSFANESINMQGIMRETKGGTECFRSNIMVKDLFEFVDKAILNKEKLIELIELIKDDEIIE